MLWYNVTIINDHEDIIMTVQQIPAGEFKAKCLNLMDEVFKTHHSITITKRGKPIARLVPVEEGPKGIFGCMKGTVSIKGDIISSVDETWDVMK